MRKTVIWILVGMILLAGAGGAASGGLARDLGLGTHQHKLVNLLYAALFAAMNLGYLSSIRGRRLYKLRGVEPGALLTIDGKPLGVWASARVQLAPDTICWASQVRYTALAIGGAALLWAVAAFYAWRALEVWWAPLPLVLLGALHVWRLTRRAVAIGTTHGSEDVFYGAPDAVSALRAEVAARLGAAGHAFTFSTPLVANDVVVHARPMTGVERSAEIPWLLVLLALGALILGAATGAWPLLIVAVVVGVVAWLLSRPQHVARFEGGADVPIPAQTHTLLETAVAGG